MLLFDEDVKMDDKERLTFMQRELPITLTGAEWLALIAHVRGSQILPEPDRAKVAALYRKAIQKIREQFVAAQPVKSPARDLTNVFPREEDAYFADRRLDDD